MYDFILKMHSGWAYLALIMLMVASGNALIGLSKKRSFTPADRRLSLFALIAVHLQFVVGLVLYFVSPKGFHLINAVGMDVMKNAEMRLVAVEHPLVNLIAVVLITIGWSRHKRTSEDKKLNSIAVFYTLGLVLLLSRIPWSSWLS
jgi:hypothetical protein